MLEDMVQFIIRRPRVQMLKAAESVGSHGTVWVPWALYRPMRTHGKQSLLWLPLKTVRRGARAWRARALRGTVQSQGE